MESVVFEKTVIESTFDYWIEAEYEYWIVHFMIGLLNHKNHFSINEYISSLATGTLDLLQDTSTYNLLENNTHCIIFA